MVGDHSNDKTNDAARREESLAAARRRFLKGGLIAAPLMVTLANRPALADNPICRASHTSRSLMNSRSMQDGDYVCMSYSPLKWTNHTSGDEYVAEGTINTGIHTGDKLKDYLHDIVHLSDGKIAQIFGESTMSPDVLNTTFGDALADMSGDGYPYIRKQVACLFLNATAFGKDGNLVGSEDKFGWGPQGAVMLIEDNDLVYAVMRMATLNIDRPA